MFYLSKIVFFLYITVIMHHSSKILLYIFIKICISWNFKEIRGFNVIMFCTWSRNIMKYPTEGKGCADVYMRDFITAN